MDLAPLARKASLGLEKWYPMALTLVLARKPNAETPLVITLSRPTLGHMSPDGIVLRLCSLTRPCLSAIKFRLFAVQKSWPGRTSPRSQNNVSLCSGFVSVISDSYFFLRSPPSPLSIIQVLINALIGNLKFWDWTLPVIRASSDGRRNTSSEPKRGSFRG